MFQLFLTSHIFSAFFFTFCACRNGFLLLGYHKKLAEMNKNQLLTLILFTVLGLAKSGLSKQFF